MHMWWKKFIILIHTRILLPWRHLMIFGKLLMIVESDLDLPSTIISERNVNSGAGDR